MNEYITVQKNTDKEVKLYVKVRGQGIPVLLVHGAIIDSSSFNDCVEYLSQYFMVINYDRRNYSQSGSNDFVDIETQADDILGIIDYYRLDKVVIVGCSLGGLIAYSFGEKYPDYVIKVILYEPSITFEETDVYDEMKYYIDKKRYNKAMYLFNLLLGESDEREMMYSEDQLVDLMENRKVFLEKEFNEVMKLRELKHIQCPLYLGVGEKSYGTFLYDNAKRISQYLNAPCLFFLGNHNAVSYLPFEFFSILLGIITLSTTELSLL